MANSNPLPPAGFALEATGVPWGTPLSSRRARSHSAGTRDAKKCSLGLGSLWPKGKLGQLGANESESIALFDTPTHSGTWVAAILAWWCVNDPGWSSVAAFESVTESWSEFYWWKADSG
jgi:hypothetical protein